MNIKMTGIIPALLTPFDGVQLKPKYFMHVSSHLVMLH